MIFDYIIWKWTSSRNPQKKYSPLNLTLSRKLISTVTPWLMTLIVKTWKKVKASIERASSREVVQTNSVRGERTCVCPPIRNQSPQNSFQYSRKQKGRKNSHNPENSLSLMNSESNLINYRLSGAPVSSSLTVRFIHSVIICRTGENIWVEL